MFGCKCWFQTYIRTTGFHIKVLGIVELSVIACRLERAMVLDGSSAISNRGSIHRVGQTQSELGKFRQVQEKKITITLKRLVTFKLPLQMGVFTLCKMYVFV